MADCCLLWLQSATWSRHPRQSDEESARSLLADCCLRLSAAWSVNCLCRLPCTYTKVPKKPPAHCLSLCYRRGRWVRGLMHVTWLITARLITKCPRLISIEATEQVSSSADIDECEGFSFEHRLCTCIDPPGMPPALRTVFAQWSQPWSAGAFLCPCAQDLQSA